MDKDIYYEKDTNGSYKTDILGLIHLLKIKKFANDSIVVAIEGESMLDGQYIETYKIKETKDVQYLEFFDEETEFSESLFEFSESEKLAMEQTLLNQFESIGFDTDDISFEYGLADMEMGIMLDSEMMSATYFIYPAETQKKEHLSFKIIDYPEALQRLKENKEVYIDYSEGVFTLFDQEKDELLPGMLLDCIWAIPETYPRTDITPETVIDRLSNWYTNKYPGEMTTEEAKHDFEMYLLLERLKELLDE